MSIALSTTITTTSTTKGGLVPVTLSNMQIPTTAAEAATTTKTSGTTSGGLVPLTFSIASTTTIPTTSTTVFCQ